MKIAKVLTIAGSDSGGGAGIQADLKTFQELGAFGMSAITAVTAQNTLGVQGVYPLGVNAIKQQIESVSEDLKPDAIKTGMLFSSEIIKEVANQINKYDLKNLVVDPVMVAKGGAPLLQQEAVIAVTQFLIPLATVVTPNIPEAEVLTNRTIDGIEDRKAAARTIYEMGAKYVVIKGGHDESSEKIVDIVFDGKEFTYLENNKIVTPHTHGTGCTFSAAIAAELAKGRDVMEAINIAKKFIHSAIEAGLNIGSGHGPTNHWAYQKRMRGDFVGCK
jgi:hydroxymethylpyrimidine/phosphomethylpyrimidine kinase